MGFRIWEEKLGRVIPVAYCLRFCDAIVAADDLAADGRDVFVTLGGFDVFAHRLVYQP